MFLRLYDQFIEWLLGFKDYRAWVWRIWYPYVTRLITDKDVTFLNYAYFNKEAAHNDLKLKAEDEKDRLCINLYDQLVGKYGIGGADVLEVSCGHGGGASYLTRYHQPKSYTATDLNAQGVAFCKEKHICDGLVFSVADAQSLPFPDNAFDRVTNVEASHCYPRFDLFLAEVSRVLESDQYFFYTDFRPVEQISDWEQSFIDAGFIIEEKRDITDFVVAGMRLNTASYKQLIRKYFPFGLRWLGSLFAGVEGSRIFVALRDRKFVYHSYCLKNKT